MIHKLLNLSRPLFTVDCETTGTDVKVDRIVSLGFERWEAAGMTKEWKTLVNPGVPIPAASTKVHGITDEMVQGCSECAKHGIVQGREGHEARAASDGRLHEFDPWPSFKYLAVSLTRGFSNCDFAGKNVRFDLRITAAEMAREGVAWSYVGARIVDAERLEQLAVPRSLSHLYEKYVRAECTFCGGRGWNPAGEKCNECNGAGTVGQKLEGAHDAMNDVRASTVVIAKQLEAHASLPRDLDALHAAQWPGWLVDDGSFKMVDGVAVCQFGKWRGRPMKSIPVSYFDWIISNDFPPDVKALASAAKLGKFPEAK